MTKNSLALAAVLLASTTLTGTANAGGLRVGLGFGFPLGHFVAHEMMHDSGRPVYNKHCDKPRVVARSTRSYDDDAPARKIVKRSPKMEAAKPVEEKEVEVKTAKLEDKTTATDATPVIYVPDTPPVSNITGTQSTPSSLRTAALTTDAPSTATTEPAKTDSAKAETPKVEAKTEKTETAKTEDEPKSKGNLQKLCRRFSAAIAGLIDVPCE